MNDAIVRILLVGAVAGAALVVARLANGRASRRAERADIDADGFTGRVLLFTDSACGTCDLARTVLESTGIEFVEVTYGAHPEGMQAAGISAVPLLVVRDERGQTVGRIAGRPSRRRVRRLLDKAGLL
jgi:glutaredoxin